MKQNSASVFAMTSVVKKTKERTVEIRNRSALTILSNVSSEAHPKHLDTLPISKISTTSISYFCTFSGLVECSISWEGKTLLMIVSSSLARSYLTDMSCSRSMLGWPYSRALGEVRISPGIGPICMPDI